MAGNTERNSDVAQAYLTVRAWQAEGWATRRALDAPVEPGTTVMENARHLVCVNNDFEAEWVVVRDTLTELVGPRGPRDVWGHARDETGLVRAAIDRRIRAHNLVVAGQRKKLKRGGAEPRACCFAPTKHSTSLHRAGLLNRAYELQGAQILKQKKTRVVVLRVAAK